MRHFRGEFDGIADEVLNRDACQPWVGVYVQPRLDVEGQIAIAVLLLQIIGDRLANSLMLKSSRTISARVMRES